jgi:hypothetical protein
MTEVFGKCAWPNMEGGLTYLVSPSLGIWILTVLFWKYDTSALSELQSFNSQPFRWVDMSLPTILGPGSLDCPIARRYFFEVPVHSWAFHSLKARDITPSYKRLSLVATQPIPATPHSQAFT